jgi:hypothetical protein
MPGMPEFLSTAFALGTLDSQRKQYSMTERQIFQQQLKLLTRWCTEIEVFNLMFSGHPLGL